MGEESCCPDAVTFLKGFIREVLRFHIRKGVRIHLWFILFIISILYKGWERAGSTSIYPLDILSFGLPFFLAFSLTANTAAGEATGHFDGSGTEVDLRVVLAEPGNSKDHTLLAEAGDSKENAFRVSFVGHYHINNLRNASGLIEGSVYIINRDWVGKLAGRKLGIVDKVLVNKVSSRTSVYHGFC